MGAPVTRYNPIQTRANCTRFCGNISVQFPFGLEEGCFAREPFHLNWTNMSSSAVLQLNGFPVIDMNVDAGAIKVTINGGSFLTGEGPLYFIGFEESLHWAAANLSCVEAQKNISGYVGYLCKCSDGFDGNPYIHPKWLPSTNHKPNNAMQFFLDRNQPACKDLSVPPLMG